MRFSHTLVAAAFASLMALGACGGKEDAAATPAGEPSPQASAAAAAAAPPEDLFAFGGGARFVQLPADADIASMSSTPLNLIDESLATDWLGEAAKPAVFVLELPDRATIERVAFDTAGMNKDEKAVKDLTVEVSDTSPTTGFTAPYAITLKPSENGQSFTLPQKATGRWVRLTVRTNVAGYDYFGMIGFHGYGQFETRGATLADVSGTYEGHSGLGMLRLKQEGSRITGCYDYREGVIGAGVEGRTIKADLIEQAASEGGKIDRLRGVFAVSSDGKLLYGLARNVDGGDIGYADYYAATKISKDIGDCPKIPGWKGQAAKSQLSQDLKATGRVRLDGVNFDFNSATLQPASYPLLDQVAQMLNDDTALQVTLEGHTDSIGGAPFNKTLSGQRAAAVQTYLVQKGVAAARLTTQGFGLEKPVASNDSGAGRAQNRRVEIVKR